MKIRNLYIVTSLAITLLIFAGCSKKDNTTAGTTSKTKTELITQASWKFQSATVNGNDWSSNIQSCQKDNTYTFATSGSGTADEGATKCNASDPQSAPFTWAFQDAEATLYMSTSIYQSGTNTFSLVSITDTQMTISFPYQTPTVPSVTLTVVVTFSH